MKTLVVFYSRTGNTRESAEIIAHNLRADFQPIYSKARFNGFIGYLKAGFQASFKIKPIIRFYKNPKDYNLIVVGTPVWSHNMCSPVRSFLSNRELKKVAKKVAFFCTQGRSGGEKAILEMEKLTKKPIATLIINARDFKDESHKTKINSFCRKLKR